MLGYQYWMSRQDRPGPGPSREGPRRPVRNLDFAKIADIERGRRSPYRGNSRRAAISPTSATW
jgi:hypothetical protein